MRLLTLLPVPLALWSLTASALPGQVQQVGTEGGILRPSGDATLTNIVLASGVSPEGNRHFSRDVFLIQPASASVRQLTNFDNERMTLGATAVAMAPDGSSVAYLTLYSKVGQQTEAVHLIDLPAGTDRYVASDTEGCLQPLCPNCVLPCLHDLHYSPDSKRIVWAGSKGNPFFVATVNSGTITRLTVPDGQMAKSPNVITQDGRLVFLRTINGVPTPWSATLDGSTHGALGYGPVTSDLVVSSDGSTFAWQYATALSSSQTLYTIQAAKGSIATIASAVTPFTSLAVSGNGTRTAFLRDSQIWTPTQVTNYGFSEVRDVAWNAAGTKVLFSTAQTGNSQTAAVWMANADGTSVQPVYTPGSINPNGVIGINSQGLPLAISPGSYFTIYGQNLHPRDEVLTDHIPVTVDGPGGSYPVQALTPWQINTFLPMNVPVGVVPIVVKLSSGRQLLYTVNATYTAPAIVTYPDAAGRQQAAAFHLSTLVPCDAQHPARAGEVIETYGFGLGATEPLQAQGSPAPFSPLARTLITPDVLVGTQKAQVLFSGLVPGLIGVYQVNIVTPAVPQGDYAMQWRTGDSNPASLGNFSIR